MSQRLRGVTSVGELGGVLRFPDARRLWMSQVLSEAGDWAARLALAVLVFDRTGSPTLTAAVAATSLVPWLGAGQALATLGDRLPRRTVMFTADLVRAVVFGVMAMPVPTWALFAAALVAGFATPPFETSRAALLPDLVPRKRYGDAVALSQMTYQMMLLLGYLGGGGLVAVVGARGALLVNAATFGASAIFVARLRNGRVAAAPSREQRRMAEAGRVLFRDALLRRAVLLAAVPASLAIAGEALVAVYARQEIGASDAMIGVLAASVPVGTIVAGLMIPRKGDHRRLLRGAAASGLIGSAVGAVTFVIAPPLPWAVIPFFAIGVVFAGVIPGNSVGGSRLPAEIRSSGFGLIQGMVVGGQALGVLAGGALAAVLGAGPASGVLLIPCFLYSAYSLLSIPDMRKSRALGPLPFGERRESTGAPAVPALRPAEVEAQA
jgi:MFS family permease